MASVECGRFGSGLDGVAVLQANAYDQQTRNLNQSHASPEEAGTKVMVVHPTSSIEHDPEWTVKRK